MEFNYKIGKAMVEMLRLLLNLMRWSYCQNQKNYNEKSKQALNSLIAYILACYAEKEGYQIQWERFPKIAIYRSFQKVYVNFDMRESILKEMSKDLSPNAFDEATYQRIASKSTEKWAKYLQTCLGTYEYNIYKAATKIATYVELLELRHTISSEIFIEKRDDILTDLKKFEDIPGVLEIISKQENFGFIQDVSRLREHTAKFKVIQEISTLRNHNRWCEQSYSVNSSVLSHLFDTACFAYFMSMEKNQDEEIAAKHFFMGIFHDIAETWTGDIPSPIKDLIPGFRKVSEQYENKMLEEKLLKRMPKFMREYILAVMFEDPSNQEHFKMIKGADYLAADLECYKMYIGGTNEAYFLGAMKRRITQIKSGYVELTPICLKLYKYFMRKAEAYLYNELDYGDLRLLCSEIFNEYAFVEDSKKIPQLTEKLKRKLEELSDEELVDVEEDILYVYFGSKELADQFLK